MQGCMLYWAEGAKSRNVAALVNSDPGMLALFLRFLLECYGVPAERIALTVNCHLGNGVALEEIERWWVDRLGLPETALRKSIVNQISTASVRKRRTPVYGTARVAVFSTFVVKAHSEPFRRTRESSGRSGSADRLGRTALQSSSRRRSSVGRAADF